MQQTNKCNKLINVTNEQTQQTNYCNKQTIATKKQTQKLRNAANKEIQKLNTNIIPWRIPTSQDLLVPKPQANILDIF